MAPSRVSDLHIESNLPLPTPQALIAEVARTDAQAEFVADARFQIQQILFGDDPRWLVVVGPCSIHDTTAGIDYARRLAALAREVGDTMLLVMRVYFEKPRTTVGWKGLIMDPHLDGTHDIPAGLHRARTFLRDVIDLGLPTATELLDPITPQYISDLICWSAIGARTTESQTHRQMASGLSMPLGFKNGTPGTITPAINAIKAAVQPQTFLGVNQDGIASAVTTLGNPHCHIILRGGENGPNYSEESVSATREALLKAGLPTAIMVDASHGNCGKDHRRMPDVFRNIMDQRCLGATHLIGTMLESNIEAGSQSFPAPLDSLTYGQSITDQCINWPTTAALLNEAASALRRAGVSVRS